MAFASNNFAVPQREYTSKNRCEFLPLACALPEPGKYVRAWKFFKQAASERPLVSGWFAGQYGTAGEHLAGFTMALTNRINHRGHIDTGDDDLFWAYRRDQRKLEDWRQRRQVWRGSGFETLECRLRFADVQAVMTDARR
jgi:hypothetical protein